MTLAALVIRQIGTMVKNVFGLRTKEQRKEYLKNVIMATVVRYLKPPDENDKWWEKLLEDDAGRAARKIKELQEKTPQYSVIAEQYGRLGDKDKAFQYLEKNSQKRGWMKMFFRVDPRFDALRDDPRFEAAARAADAL